MIVVPGYFQKLLLFLLIFVRVECDLKTEEMVLRLDSMITEIKPQRISRDTDDGLKIWQEYEFGTGVGNREELIVTDVNIEDVEALSIDGIKNWQYLPGFRHGLLAGSGESSLWLCRRDNEDGRVDDACLELSLTERILTFKVISLSNHSSNSEDIIAILCVQSGSETKLHWYKIMSSGGFELAGSSPVARPVERIEFFRINGRNKLLLVNEPINHDGAINSSIDIYGFGFVGGLLEFWFCQRIQKPRVSSLEICSIYDGTYLSIQSQDTVSLYEFKEEETKEGLFKFLQNVTSNGLKNSVCFENGYTEYLILSGKEPALYTFLENEFYYDIETEELFNALGEILWVQCLPVETYREECLLLIQLKNFTVIGLSWQGQGFRAAALPALNIDNFLLSQITVIPKYGFIIGNKMVKVETELQELRMPVNYEMETILQLKSSLKETFLKQEVILNETEKRIQASYYTNPVITGFWNFAEVVTNTATMSKNVTYDSLIVGSKSFSAIDEAANVTILDEQFRTLDKKMEKISLISGSAVRADSPEVHIDGLSLNGGIEVIGTTNVNNITFEYLNGLTLNDIIKDFVNFDDAGILIEGSKSFPSIEASHINVGSINGVSLKDVEFATENRNYESIDFTVLNQLVVNGDLTVPRINGITWDDLMKKVVWITESTTIPGLTIIRGEVFADTVVAGTLNGLRYPEDYVVQNSTADTKISGLKTFGDVKVENLKGIKTINGIPYEDFVTLNSEQNLPNQITFKNLIVGENLKIDGRVTGIEVDREDHRFTLSDTNVITADTTFTNLYVTGNIIVGNSVNGKLLSDFDDILQKSEEQAVINGQKTFRGNVEIETALKVTSKKYNGHPIDEFATFSGEQVFSNLRKISAPVTFEALEYKQLSDLGNYLSDLVRENEDSECSRKKLIFNVPPFFDDISFQTLNDEISASHFSKNFHHTFSNVIFEDLRVKNVYADAVTPDIINGVDFTDFEEHRMSVSSPQILTGNYKIWNLKAGKLVTEIINGMTLDELEKFRNDFEDLFNKIWNGRMMIETFIVKGNVRAKSINGELLANIYSRNQPRNLIVGDGFDVETLEVYGFVNGLNLTEFVADSVFKTDSDVVLTGEKTIDNLNCQILEFPVLNGIPVANIVNPNVVQNLTGPVAVKGNVFVEKSFSSDGKINDVIYKQLIDRFSYSGSNTLELHGNFRFVGNCDVENLQIDGPIQGITFDSFLDTAIFQGDDVHISGSKIFTNSVTFGENFTISNEYNGLDLGPFNHKAIFTDSEIHIGCEIIFKEDLILDGDLIVEEKLNCKTISHVDIEELMSSAIFLDRASYVPGTLTFTNATFESGMTVGYLNGIDLNSVITLKEDQTIFEPLSFVNVSVETLDTTITVNGHTMDQIFANTFMLSGNQTITGNLIFHGNVQMLNNFDPESLNGIVPSQMVSRDEDERLTGTFEFTSPLILRKDFRVFGLVNDIALARWESEAVYDVFPKKQLVTGNWFIRGNVTFEKNVMGSGLLNGIDVRKLFDEVERRNLEVETMVNGVKMDLESTCKDLTPLQKYAKNQIHRFKFFEYLQIFEFSVTIKSVHHFEVADVDLLLINLDNCFLNTLFYNGSEFTFVQSKDDFDNVEKWTTLEYEGAIYFLTIGSGSCGWSIGNLWKFEQETMVHILDLGRIIDVKKIGDYVFLVIFEERLEKWSIEDVHNGIYGNSTSYFAANEHMHFVPNTERILVVADNYIHEFDHQFLNHTSLLNHFGNGVSHGLQAGIHEKEMFLYYNEKFSENTAFIFDDLPNMKIRQSIPIHRPNSFLAINFDSLVETFLTFVQNGRSLEIFEYKGIEGFVYRESIKMQVDRTFGLKLRKQPGLSKTNLIGAIHGKSLKIIEAQMYGEKLDVEYLDCENSL